LAANVYQSQTDLLRPGLPWENQPRSFATWWETTKLCMTQPSYAFSIMRRRGGLAEPMIFVAISLAVGALGQLIWGIPLVVLMSLAWGRFLGQSGEIAVFTGFQVVIFIFRSMLGIVMGATLGLLILSAILHVCLMAVGAARQPFETTLRAFAYAKGSTVWLNVIPGGVLVLVPWLIVLEIVGLTKAHEIDMGKSALAVFLPMIVICGCVIGFAAVFAGIAIANAN